jgi:O-antigen/teichoic acid export membrane protein
LSLATVLPLASVTAVLAGPVIHAWVGEKFAGAVPVVWVLALVMAVRMGTSTGTSILKGAGQHRFVAACSVALALTNLGLSMVLARWFGLIGVAIGTLIPVTIISVFVMFPVACRRVHLPIGEALRSSVWPAVWPMFPTCLALLAARNLLGHSLPLIGLGAVAAGLVYAAIFLFLAIPRDERKWYFDKMGGLLQRQRQGQPAAA